MTPEELVRLAAQAMKTSYSPYSRFAVGAALLCRDGTVVTGCNIENAAYSPSVCAERTAVVKAVSEGKREFAAIAVVGGPRGKPGPVCPPCGVCRQVLAEFCDPAMPVYLGKAGEGRGKLAYETYRLSDLLPCGFSADAMKVKK